MAVITSAASGNFSAPATWVGGVVPTSVDDAVAANGHVVTIDTNVTVISVQQVGTGKFTLGNGRTLTGNVIANAGTFTSGGTVEVTATTGNTATINGNVTGVSSTAVNIAGIVVTGTGALIVNGSVTGSAGNASSESNGHAGIYTNVNSTITINGVVNGGTGNHKRGFQSGLSSNGLFSITGNVNSGSGTQAGGAWVQGISASLTITGDVNGGSGGTGIGAWTQGGSASLIIVGNVTGGTGSAGFGAYTQGGSAILTVTGNVTAGIGSLAYGVTTTGGSAVITVTGNITGSSNGLYGVWVQGGSSLLNVVGNLFGIGQASNAVRSDSTAANSGVVLTGNMTDSSLGATALFGRIFRLVSTPSGITTYTNNVGYPTGGSVTRVSPDNVTGMPAAANVRSGLTYGYNNQLTGQAVIPPASSVAAGAEVDNTVGTAALDIGALVSVVGAQIAAATTTPVGI